jgi:hypothetical protein
MLNSEELSVKPIQYMDSEQAELYARIRSFSIDRPEAQLSFSQRLARDNGWSLDYAVQVIDEYKNFIFLAVTAGHPVTPSDQVDQVWHLHLSYTRSYWDEFCPQVLQTALHHEPTLGGQAESQKFDDWYSKTLDSYRQFFGAEPPVEIWPKPMDRFDRDLYFERVNTQQNWVLDKSRSKKQAEIVISVLLTLISSSYYVIKAEGDINPFAGILLAATCVSAGLGLIKFLVGTVDFLRDPKLFRAKRGWDKTGCGSADYGGVGCGGCGGGGCGGCGGG